MIKCAGVQHLITRAEDEWVGMLSMGGDEQSEEG